MIRFYDWLNWISEKFNTSCSISLKNLEKAIFTLKTNLMRGSSHLNMYAFKYESLLVGANKYLSLKYDKM